jgi:hypothetical protein
VVPWLKTDPMVALAPILAQARVARSAADASGSQELNSTAPEMSEPAEAAEAGGTELPDSAGGLDAAHAPTANSAVIVTGIPAHSRLALLIAASADDASPCA